eukprot:m.68840 g.68840  ORF g.68840 m.68840 type:complete len:169 (+) comp24004_c0_seq2:437-943(+)
MLKTVIGAGAGLGVMVGGYASYDYSTCHPLRKKHFKLKETCVRFHNDFLSNVVTGNDFTLDMLKKYDGVSQNEMYFACAGKVYDVTESEMFRNAYPLWAGKDATVSLGLMSLKEQDASRLDWNNLTDDQWKSVASWNKYFDQKYLIRGRVEEFDTYHHQATSQLDAED